MTIGRSTAILLLGVGLLTAVVLLLNRAETPPEPALAPAGLARDSAMATTDADTSLAEAASAPAAETRQAVARARDKREPRARADAPPPKASAGPFLSGTVFGSEGLPIRDAKVKVEGDLGGDGFLGLGKIALSQETTTDPKGDFAVPRGHWPGQDVKVQLEARGYQLSAQSRAPDSASGDARLGTFVLQRGVVLGGHVYDANGRAVEGAKVRRTSLEDTGAMDGMIALASTFGQWKLSQSITDAEGAFELGHEVPGPYALIVEHEDYPKARHEGETPREGGEDLTVVIRLAPTATLTGRILDYPGGRRNVSVTAVPTRAAGEEPAPIDELFGSALSTDDKAQVGEDGSFSLSGLDVGRNYHVQAFVRDGLFARTPCTERKQVPSGMSGVELQWESGARVSLELEDATTGAPMRGGTVRYRWEESSGGMMGMTRKARDFPGSHVLIDELRPTPSPSKLELMVSVEGYLEHRISGIEVHELEQLDLGIIRLRLAPLLRVRVVDAASGQPVSRARVVLQPEYGGEGGEFFALGGEIATGRTDSEGICEVPACGSATGTLTVNKGGYAPTALAGLAMPVDGRGEELVRLSRGGEVRVEVLESDGRPAPEAEVTHRDPAGTITTLTANAKGELRVRDLALGTHAFAAERSKAGPGGRRRGGIRVSLDDEASGTRWQEAVVTSGGRVDLRIDLPATARVEGLVLLRGEPVAQASITLMEGEAGSDQDEYRAQIAEKVSTLMPDAPASARTDGEGRFVLDDVEAGKHRIRVARGGGMPSHYAPIDVRIGTNRIEIALPGSAVEGRVTTADGAPIASARVEVLRFDPDDPAAGRSARMDLALSFFGAASSSGARTDGDGRFEIEGVPIGVPVVVEARAPGFVSKRSKDFQVAQDSVERGVEVALARSGSIRVRVEGTLDTFQTVRATLEGEAEDGPASRMALLKDGAALLADLRPGTWRVSVDRGEAFELVEVRPGEESFVTLVK